MENKETLKYPIEKFADKSIVINMDSLFDPHHLLIANNYNKYVDKVIASKGLISDRVERLALDIVRDYAGKTVYFLIVMKGAVMFGSNLADKINDILKNDISDTYKMQFFFEYIRISSYENLTSTGVVNIKADDKILSKVKDQHVIIVEDTYDSGKTLVTFTEYLNKNFTPLSLKTAVLVQKMNPAHLKLNFENDYIGFLVPNEFIIGYGLDYNQRFRELPHLCTINQLGIDTFREIK
jgi:hypoxanthine phosphoribosyltransferase